MARWKLKTPHYLMVPGTRWEYTENNRTNGRPERKLFDVPRYLHPEDLTDWNWKYDRDSGDIIVCYEGKGDPSGKDIVFKGKPTPDMEPLDDEAKAITERDVRPMLMNANQEAGGYASNVLEELSLKLAQAMTNGPDSGSMDKLVETMNEMMKQNAQLISTLAALAIPQAASRRV